MFDIAVVLKFMLLSKGTAYDSGFPLFLFRLHGFMWSRYCVQWYTIVHVTFYDHNSGVLQWNLLRIFYFIVQIIDCGCRLSEVFVFCKPYSERTKT